MFLNIVRKSGPYLLYNACIPTVSLLIEILFEHIRLLSEPTSEINLWTVFTIFDINNRMDINIIRD